MTLRTALPLVLLALGACGESTQAPKEPAAASSGYELPPGATMEDVGEVLAVVQGIPVGTKEYERAAARLVPEDGVSLSEEERRQVLSDLVDEKMLYLEARKQGIDRDPKVQKVMVNTLLRQEVYAAVRNSDFTEEELRAYFDSHRDEFDVPEKLQVHRIFVRVRPDRGEAAARELVEGLRAQIVANPDVFEDLASEHSEDPYRRRGGDLGYISAEGKPGVPPEVVDKAFELDVGEVSDVFLADGGVNLVYIANKRDKVERTYEQMKGSVLRRVKNDRYRELYDQYTEELAGTYEVEIHEDKLSTLELPERRRGPRGPGIRAIGTPGGVRGVEIDGADDVGDEGEE